MTNRFLTLALVLQLCRCQPGFRQQMVADRMECHEYHSVNWVLIGSCIATFALLFLGATFAGFFFFWHRHLSRLAQLHKKQGPPGTSCDAPATLYVQVADR